MQTNFRVNHGLKKVRMLRPVGETKDVMTTYMEGTPFEARTLRPTEQGLKDDR